MRAHVWHCFWTPRTGRGAALKRRFRRWPHIEPLEERSLLAADIRTISGDNNNLQHPSWGSTDEELLRRAPAEYSDGISAPAGADRPSARAVSDLLAVQDVENIFNDRNMSAMIYAWGQFLDHDLDLTDAATPAEPLNIAVPKGDPFFDPTGSGDQIIPFTRSSFDPATGTSQDDPRQQINRITAFIDGSQIYGSDAARAAALRTFVGGRLKTSAGDLLPLNTMGLANDNPMGLPATSLYAAGDVRANENIELTSLQTLFVREHNRLAGQLAASHPGWSDEQIYQQARRLVVGELQAITYNEWLPALLGPGALRPYQGYNPNVNPDISNEFSTAAFRLGHSLLGNDVEFLDNQGEATHDEIPLRQAFFNPQMVAQTGIDPILKYLTSDPAQEIDTHVVDEVRNFLFGRPGQGGFDLASLNIQRGRDHGLANYNSTRVAYGLRPVHSFAEITSDDATQAELKAAYGNVNNIDLWVGGLAEDHVAGGSVGPLFRRILVDQFQRLRDGDRFWYERDLKGADLTLVRNTSLADVISRNTTTTNLQDNVFFFYNTVSGKVFFDADQNGRFNRGDAGLRGLTVQLLDADGNLIASAITARDGSYSFENVDLGVYRVRLVVPTSWRLTTPTTGPIDMTRGEEVPPILFGIVPKGYHSRHDQLAGPALHGVSSEIDAGTLLDPAV